MDHLMSLSESAHLVSKEQLSSACYPFLAAGLDLLEDLCEKLIGRGEEEIDEFGADQGMIEIFRPFFQFLYYNYFRVKAEGMFHVPSQGPAILVANHAGVLPYDGSMVHLAVYNEHQSRRDVRFLVDDFVFRLPLVGTIVQRTGGIRANPENATRLIRHGHVVMVFPEGVRGMGKTYDQRYQLQQFGRGGFVRLALRTGAPIIPVAIIGSEEIHPLIWKSHQLAKPLHLPFMPFTPTFPWLGPLGVVPLPSKWHIIFGQPVHLDHLRPSDAENQELVSNETEQIRGIIQRMIDKALVKRKSMWV
jgi:1-acyl-sn-glycerol-3-phosphate acyltransferase